MLIEDFIKSQISLSNDELETLDNYYYKKKLLKNETLLCEGEICGFVSFICKGALIYYKLLENGNEVTTDFAFEGEWAADNFSRITNTPSQLYIKAIEDSELIIINSKNLELLFGNMPAFEKLGRILSEQALIRVTQLSVDLQALTAKERYLKLLNKYPDIFNKVQLHHIANYLGIAPKSLSRIRKEISAR